MGRKWNNIKEKKASADRSRAQVYTKMLRDVTIAAKKGGESPDSNFMLRIALDKCRKYNVPKDNIERAIKRGLGGETDDYFDITYEGYGVNGVAVFVEASTNNVTRTAANVKSYFNKSGGSLGTSGCLQFVFDHKAVFEVPVGSIDEESFTLELIDAGADDIVVEDGDFVITGNMASFGAIQKKLDELKVTASSAGLERVPTNHKEVNKETFDQIMKLVNMLEEDDDVNKVYHNIQYDEALFA